MAKLPQQVSESVRKLNPHLYPDSHANNHKTSRQVSHPKPKRDKASALGGAAKGKTQGVERVRVRFTGYRVRPLDPDNFAGSVKDCLDFLRHAAIIEGDEPWRIILETEQVKVAHFKDERTEITVEIP